MNEHDNDQTGRELFNGTPNELRSRKRQKPSPGRKPLRKFEAVGCLCEIRKYLQRSLESELSCQAKCASENDADGVKYFAEEIEKRQRWIEALEMAGNQFTR